MQSDAFYKVMLVMNNIIPHDALKHNGDTIYGLAERSEWEVLGKKENEYVVCSR